MYHIVLYFIEMVSTVVLYSSIIKGETCFSVVITLCHVLFVLFEKFEICKSYIGTLNLTNIINVRILNQ